MAPAMTGQRPCDPCSVVIFGAAGDLTKRKLIPALYNLSTYGLLSPNSSMVGVARRPLKDEDFRTQVAKDLQNFATSSVTPEVAKSFASQFYFVGGDISDPAAYQALKERLAELQKAKGGGNVLFYMATPPSAFGEIARGLAAVGLTKQDGNG